MHTLGGMHPPPQFKHISVLHVRKYNFDYSLKIILALLPAKLRCLTTGDQMAKISSK